LSSTGDLKTEIVRHTNIHACKDSWPAAGIGSATRTMLKKLSLFGPEMTKV